MKIFSFLFISLFSLSIFAASITGKVIKVYDGDTIKIVDEDGGKFIIRFANIDAPEKDQEFGDKSKEYLEQLLMNHDVLVKFLNTDMYGRLVGTVYTKKIIGNIYSINVNEELLKNGYVWFYASYSKDKKLKELENEAKKNKLGLWKNENPKEPWIYRKEQKSLKNKIKSKIKNSLD